MSNHPRFMDLTGETFDYWTVLKRGPDGKGRQTRWECRCRCGTVRVISGHHLRHGASKSCGCRPQKPVKHGEARVNKRHSPTYRAWRCMRARTVNPSARRRPDARYYVEKGVTCCERWNSYENFLADMGERPEGMTLDRMDSSGNYEPGNCRWATTKQQLESLPQMQKGYQPRMLTKKDLYELDWVASRLWHLEHEELAEVIEGILEKFKEREANGREA